MSSDLQWLLIRKQNAFMVKKVPEGPIFSKEPGNLMNLHSFKFSGLVNTKTIDVQDTENGVSIVSRKPSASPHSVSSARHTTSIRQGSTPRRASGIAVGHTRRSYRPDLRRHVLARVSALQVSHKTPKPTPEKKKRGKKAKVV